MTNQPKRLLLFTAKLGYQTRSFEDAAQKLGVRLVYVTDRCHQLEDPWGDQAIAVHFESPEAAAYTVMEALRGQDVRGIFALGDRPAVAAAYTARGLGLHFNHPAAVEACRSKLRMREVFRDAGLRVPWFRHFPIEPAPEPALLNRFRFRPARVSCARITAKNFSRPRRVCGGCWSPPKFVPLASQISIKCLSKVTYRAGKWQWKGFSRTVLCARWRSSINLIHSRDRTSKRRSTLHLLGFPNHSSMPCCSAREMPREHSACRTGRFTPNFESTRPVCGRSKLRPGPSAGSVPAPYDSRPASRQNRSGSKNCFFAMLLNFPVTIRHAKGLPPEC